MFLETALRLAPAWFTKDVIDVAIPARNPGLVALYVGLFIGSQFIWLLQDGLQEVMPLMRRVERRMAALNVVIQEYVAGVKMIQAFGREPHEAGRFDEVNGDIRASRMKQQQVMAVVMPGQE